MNRQAPCCRVGEARRTAVHPGRQGAAALRAQGCAEGVGLAESRSANNAPKPTLRSQRLSHPLLACLRPRSRRIANSYGRPLIAGILRVTLIAERPVLTRFRY